MAKTNNKGFSLIEIIIAVAILSILLTPIIRQFANTMETSRKAKALQEANEVASYEIEEFQGLSKAELDAKYTSSETSVAEYKKTAKLVDKNGQAIMDGTSEAEVEYSVYQYNLKDSEVGAKKDRYTNTVLLDDLSNQVRDFGGKTASTHYKIAYGLTKSDLASDALKDFTLTNEGSAVEYDADGFVKTVVCTDKNGDSTDVVYVQNPNTVNLGNMHDLDKNSVALILGGTSSYDSEAYAALFSKAMDHLKVINRDSWEQALVNVDNESILSQDALSNSKRLIKIYADKTDEATNEYVVKVDVYYIYNYSLNTDQKDASGNIKTQSFTDMVSYTVFSQKFPNMEKAPEIYFEYQPYCLTGDTTSASAVADVQYQADDYILFDNYVDECKLYLYKPYKDQMNADAADADGSAISDAEDGNKNKYKDYEDAKADGHYTYYTDKSKSKKVTIHLASKTNSSKVSFDSTGKYLDTNTTKRMYVYTNLDIDGYKDGKQNANGTRYQFVSDAFTDDFKFVKGEKETAQTGVDELDAVYLKYAFPNVYQTREQETSGSYVDGDDIRALYTLSEDTREAERLYTVTVTLTPDSNSLNTIRLSGAKGAN